VERNKPRVFPRPDILTIRTTNVGSGISTGLPRMAVLAASCDVYFRPDESRPLFANKG
jgi:hypothetical protein